MNGPNPLRRLHAELLYARHGVRVLARPLLLFVVVVLIGGVVEHEFGSSPGSPPQTWTRAFFVSYTLMFSEHLEETPTHVLAQLMHYGQPLLGVLVVSEGILRLGVNLLNRESNARTWVEIMAATTKQHVILCGLGSVGFRVAEELVSMGVEVFAVERDPNGQFVERARMLGVHVLIGDARAEDLLVQLHIDKARAIIVATDDDLANLEIAMDAREIAKDVHVVMRLFDQRLAQKVRSVLGIEASVSTSRLAAPLFASAALDPGVVGTHRIGETVLVVVQVRVGEGSVLRGQSYGSLSGRGMTVVGVRGENGQWELSPKPDRWFTVGEQLQVLVKSDQVDELHRIAAG
ncbi:MAG: NAD-binding protein [Alphaproteobacteria bacterium]|nr:NAD-binding protein [Alphaproteobacteria bacterium]MCB9695813.1 NAD-binding protein [Alphaproteobacteria bacterium]